MLDKLPRLLVAVVVPTLALIAASRVAEGSPGALEALGYSTVLLVVGRCVSCAAIRRLRRAGTLRRRAVIVGAGAVGSELHTIFNDRPEYGVDSVGLVDDVPFERGLPLLGPIDEIGDTLDRSGATMVVVAFGPRGEQDLVSVLRAVQHRDIDIAIVPRFFELGLAPSGPDVETVWGIPLYRVRRSALSRWNWPVKRTMDLIVAAALLALLAPVLGVVALVVRLTSPGPILFRQQRIGQNGHPIEVLKFRTMLRNDDSDVTWSVDDDPRITPVGGWLRRLSLDELPQLWNVLCGDMSLVGPRPERPHFVAAFSEQVAGYPDRHRVPAGLTGFAQIHGLRGDTSIPERARFDNAYVEHWTPWFDIKIILRTMTAIVRDASLRTVAKPEPVRPSLGEVPRPVATVTPLSQRRPLTRRRPAPSRSEPATRPQLVGPGVTEP